MSMFCHRRGVEIFRRLVSVHERPNAFVLHTPARRPPHITGRRVNAVIGFVDQCLTIYGIADQGVGVLGFHRLFASVAHAKYMRIDVYV